MNPDAAAQLAEGIASLRLDLPPSTAPRLLDYLALLQKWNRTYNLTAVRDVAGMVSQHLLDCLAILPHVPGGATLDVGSGAGLPGIPLALATPQRAVTLLESSQKKAAFLRQAKAELALENVTVVCARAESWRPGRPFEMVISRALSDLSRFVGVAGSHVAPGGVLAAMKGVFPHEEIARLPRGWRVREAIALAVPGVAAQRHLLLLART